ncbi:hypothetical protein [Nesterenkonia halotolerans]|uniref:Glucan phosphoethanolaminetransferase (Alkaline phosphatase superfamily) n=1 Tax=Nesterenkonia halotolerans TaxID=225325 RepID=A0ABR9J3Y4_9MICC|nr:glucan phosphoethanolaminetransferase (alkaline phosphatase superfamily) [Nesterenkonia halotolerans]
MSGLAVLVAIAAIGARAWQNLISQYELEIDMGVPRSCRLVIPIAIFILTLLVLRLSRAAKKLLVAIGVISLVSCAATVLGMLSDTLSIGGGLLWMTGEALSVVVGFLVLVLAVLSAVQATRTLVGRRGVTP